MGVWGGCQYVYESKDYNETQSPRFLRSYINLDLIFALKYKLSETRLKSVLYHKYKKIGGSDEIQVFSHY